MKPEIYCCIKCQHVLSLFDNSLICAQCGSTYPVVDDVPYFVANDAVSEVETSGLVSRLFESPVLYDWLVKLKAWVAPDQLLGIRDITDNRSLLNIGCGSNVEGKHLEYEISKLSAFAACDLSHHFVHAAKRGCSRKDAEFCVASIDNLPYVNSSFDVVIVPFVLHHLPFSYEIAIKEAVRIAKDYVIIYDHVKDGGGSYLVDFQEFYWRTFDGGYQYLTLSEWRHLLKDFNVYRELRTGAIGRHVFKLVLKKL